MDDTLELGGNIELSGFREIDPASMIVVKKIVGNYARKFSNKVEVQKLKITMKQVHGDESRYEIHSTVLTTDTNYISEITDHNLFFVLDKAMKKLEQQLG